jgi:sugar/nucleoside kinase (ribokinase family)
VKLSQKEKKSYKCQQIKIDKAMDSTGAGDALVGFYLPISRKRLLMSFDML